MWLHYSLAVVLTASPLSQNWAVQSCHIFLSQHLRTTNISMKSWFIQEGQWVRRAWISCIKLFYLIASREICSVHKSKYFFDCLACSTISIWDLKAQLCSSCLTPHLQKENLQSKCGHRLHKICTEERHHVGGCPDILNRFCKGHGDIGQYS